MNILYSRKNQKKFFLFLVEINITITFKRNICTLIRSISMYNSSNMAFNGTVTEQREQSDRTRNSIKLAFILNQILFTPI